MIYLDHAATTPLRPAARAAWLRWSDAEVGNASAAHAPGRNARTAVEEARELVAGLLGASPHDIVFTSGGTEADNLAIKGIAWARADNGHRHLVTTAVEHPAVLDSAAWLAGHQGFELTLVPPQRDGRVDPERLLAAVRPDTALVSVMAANNELGSVNDIGAIAAGLADRGVPLHVDAVQAASTLDVDVRTWPVDALSLSAHKFGGPTGVGVAYIRRGVPVVPLLHGGGQDRGVRSGTFAAALDAACAAALADAVATRPELRQRLDRLGNTLATSVAEAGGVRRNGPPDPGHRLASHVHLSIEGIDAEALLWSLDQAGVAASIGSACHSGANSGSHVLRACGLDDIAALRLSLGWTTTDDEVARAGELIVEAIDKLRAVGGGGLS